MKKLILIYICILFFKVSYSTNPLESNELSLNKTTLTLNKNYQQFKYQVINFETTDIDLINKSSLKRRKNQKNDVLMLYVAGGLAIATTTLILTSDTNNFTSNSSSSVTTGIAIGGTLACGMIVAKYFIDKSR